MTLLCHNNWQVYSTKWVLYSWENVWISRLHELPHFLPLTALDQRWCQVGGGGRGHVDGSKLLQPNEEFSKDTNQLWILTVECLAKESGGWRNKRENIRWSYTVIIHNSKSQVDSMKSSIAIKLTITSEKECMGCMTWDKSTRKTFFICEAVGLTLSSGWEFYSKVISDRLPEMRQQLTSLTLR